MTRIFDPAHAAANGYTKADWEAASDNPEWTGEDFGKAVPFKEAFPDLHASIPAEARAEGEKRRRGPPRTKEAISIRLDIDLVQKLRATGPGWQSKVNEIVRAWFNRAA